MYMMLKKTISLGIIICILTVILCGCSVYKYTPAPEEFDTRNIIGHTYDEIVEIYGSPDTINGINYEHFDHAEPIYNIGYKTRNSGTVLGFDQFAEYYYIEFNKVTGLANVAYHPWYEPV